MRHATCALGFALLTSPLTGCGYFGFDSLNEGSPIDAGSDVPGLDGGGAPQLRDLCAFTAVTVILDGSSADDDAGATLAAAVASGCATSPTVQMLSQNATGLLHPTTHAPLFGASTLGVLGGGQFSQALMSYLEAGATPVQSEQTATDWIITRRSTGAVLASRALVSLSATHDVAVIQVSRDVGSGSVVLSAYGLYYGGTLAAAYYFAHVLDSTIATDGREFYVVEWTNADVDPDPSAGDTFAVLAMGP